MKSQSSSHESVSPEIRAVIAAVVAEAGLDLEEVQLRPAGGRQLLRVLVDTDGGVTLDAVAAVSTAISVALDDSGAMGSRPYVLDVGSPGIDRPLSLVRHWRRNIGRLVRITDRDGNAQVGRIVSVVGPTDDGAPSVVTLDREGGTVEVQTQAMRRAVVQVEFTDAQPLED